MVLPGLLQTCQPLNAVVTSSQSQRQAKDENKDELSEPNDLRKLALAEAEITSPDQGSRGQILHAAQPGNARGYSGRRTTISSVRLGGNVPDDFEQLEN